MGWSLETVFPLVVAVAGMEELPRAGDEFAASVAHLQACLDGLKGGAPLALMADPETAAGAMAEAAATTSQIEFTPWAPPFPADNPDGADVRQVAGSVGALLRAQVRIVLWDAPANFDPHDIIKAGFESQISAEIYARTAISGRVGTNAAVTRELFRHVREPWRPPYRRLDPPQEGVTIILSPTTGASKWIPHAATSGEEEARDAVKKLADGLARANHDTASIAEGECEQALKNIFGADFHNLSDAQKSLALAYARANALTKRSEKSVRRVRTALLGPELDASDEDAGRYAWSRFRGALFNFTFLACVLFAVFAKTVDPALPGWHFGWLGAYILVVGGALISLRRLRKSRAKDEAEDWRAVAEAMRVQLFWDLAGVGSMAADHFPRSHKAELLKLRAMVQNIALHPDSQAARAAAMAVPPEMRVDSWWLVEQERHYIGQPQPHELRRGKANKAQQHARAAVTTHALGEGVAAAGMWLTGVLLLAGCVKAFHAANGDGIFTGILLSLLPLMIVAFASWHRDDHEGSMHHNPSLDCYHHEGRSAGLIGGVMIMALLLLIPGFAIPLMAAMIGYHGELHPIGLKTGPEYWLYYMIAGIGLLALLGGILHSQEQVRGDALEAREFAQMGGIFARAREHLAATMLHAQPPKPPQDREVRRMLKETGRQALHEVGRRLIHYRHRAIDLGHTS